MATHSTVLAWRIPGMAEPGGLLSMGSHRVGHDWNDLAAIAAALGSVAISWKSWLCFFFFLSFFCFCSENKMLHRSELNSANPFLYHNTFLLPVTILLCQSWEVWFLLSFSQYLGPLSSKIGNSGVTLKGLYNSHVTYNYYRQLSERPHITVISFLYPPVHLVSH